MCLVKESSLEIEASTRKRARYVSPERKGTIVGTKNQLYLS